MVLGRPSANLQNFVCMISSSSACACPQISLPYSATGLTRVAIEQVTKYNNIGLVLEMTCSLEALRINAKRALLV